MPYAEATPGRGLRSSVDRFWRLESNASGAQRVLPDGCVDVIVDLRSGRARVVGAMTKPLITTGSAASYLSVRFKPGTASRFLGVPMNALTDQTIELRDLGHFDAFDNARNVAELSNALLRRAEERSPRIEHAVRLLNAGHSTSSVAKALEWSRQHLRRVFEAHVGLSPKQFACVARMQRTLITLQNTDQSLAEAATTLGYSDQSHLARELRLLVGATATEVRRDAGSILPIHSLYGAAGSLT